MRREAALWGRLNSINVQKVAWALDEIGLDYERIDAGGPFGVVASPEYRQLNPNGLVPTLEHDGFVLWESNAIVRYLAALHPEAGLWPQEPRARTDADRWMDWQATHATPQLRDGFWQLVRTPPEKRDHAVIARSLAGSAEAAAILDRHLAGRPYVAGEAFTAGDIATGTHAHRWLNLPIERPPLPHLAAWYERLKRRPRTQAILTLPVT